jgi:drug/metabolite transporter (DMT)-like permease
VLIGGVVALAFASIFFRKASPTHPLVASGTRLCLAALILLPLVLRAAVRRRLPARQVRAAVLAGAAYAVHFGTWVWSLGLTTVAASVTLVTATPLLLAVAAVVTGRDRPERRHWVSIGLAAVGVTLIGGHDFGLSSAALIGDGLALTGAAAMAAYLTIARRLGETLDLWAFSGIATAVGGASLLAVAAATGVPLVVPTTEAFLFLAAAALLPQLVGHVALTWSLRHATPVVVGIATVGEPVGATILGWFWLGEAVPPVTAAGCTVTLAAVLIAMRRASAPRDEAGTPDATDPSRRSGCPPP